MAEEQLNTSEEQLEQPAEKKTESLSPKELKKQKAKEEKERKAKEKLEKKEAKAKLKEEQKAEKDKIKKAKKAEQNKEKEEKKTKKEAAEPPAPFSMNPFLKFYFIFIIFVFSAVGAFALVKLVLLPKVYESKAAARIEQLKDNRKVDNEVGVMYNLQSITVNTFGSMGRKFVVAEIAVEAKSQDILDEVKARQPRFRDALIKYLRGHSAKEIADPSFPPAAKDEIKRIINSNLSVGWIDSIYFMKLIVN